MRGRYTYLTVIFLLIATWAAAQEAAVEGRVVTANSGASLGSARVELSQGTAVVYGSTADENGTFGLPAVAAGEYLLDVAIHAKDGAPYDYQRRHLSFSVTVSEPSAGLYRPEHHWEFDSGVSWKKTPD